MRLKTRIVNSLFMRMEGRVPTHVENPEDKARRLERDKIAHEDSVEVGAEWLLSQLNRQDRYSERILLKRDRSFELPQGNTEFPANVSQLVRSVYDMDLSQNGLYKLTREISQKHPELKFSFSLSPDGAWIEYTVEKQYLTIGDSVQWESQGVLQWQQPRKITSFEQDKRSGRVYAFVDGDATGIPLDELARAV